MTDRWSYKPVAIMLLIAVVLATGALVAVVIAPPFLGAGVGINVLGKRLDAMGADFTHIPRPPQRSTIYANDGKTVLANIYLDNREIVPLSKISTVTQQAAIAIEDAGFYHHGALDIPGLFRAAIANLKAGTVVEGGSTITQQLVKMTLESDSTDKSFARKFQEAALALKVEQRYTKDKILEMYLNEAFMGNNVYGVGTAAEFYFHKPASELTLTEGALLAGLLRSPSHDEPLGHPTHALLRRNDVLNAMMRVGWLTPKKNAWAKEQPLGLAKNVGKFTLPTPPFIVNYVEQQIVDDPHGWYQALGATPEARTKMLQEGGLKITTTFDAKSYQEALAAARAPWAQRPLYPNHSPPADVGIVSIDVPTGAIHTMLSGKHYQQDQINTVTTLHEPGSSFKPYLLASAFEEGIPPTKTYSGAQGAITDPRCETNGQPWVVTNAEGTSLGMLDLYKATAESVNAVFARLVLDVGPDKLVQVAHRMGITSYLPPVCSLAVGAYGISPLDQASGYQTLANQGVHCVPYAVQKITQGDQVLFEARPDCYRAIPIQVANLVTDLLKGPVTYGTASSAFSGWGPWPIVGKTGTATDNKAVWFAGYTRQLSTAVWVGSLGQPYPLAEYWGYDVFGGSIAAPIWRAYMSKAMQGMPSLPFPTPKLVQVPNVVGKTQSVGQQILRQLGFHVTSHTVASYLPAGTIAEQSPAGGSQTIAGAQVTLGISNGVAPVHKLPDVVGMTLAQAKKALTSANYFVSVVDKAVSNEKQDGVVLAQDPAAGSSVAEGTTVTLTVGTFSPGGGGGSPTPTPSPSPSSSPSPGH